MCPDKTDKLPDEAAKAEDSPILDEIDILSQAQRSLEAVHLIRLGARATLVCQLTGLGRKTVSDLFLKLTGLPPPPGQLPFTDSWYLRSNLRKLHANVVWRLYQHFGAHDHSDPGLIIHVYQTYLHITQEPILTLSRAYFVPRLITINAWYEHACSRCGLRYIGPPGNHPSTCPACVEYFRHRCQSCGGEIETCSLGRRKTRCSRCHEERNKTRNRARQTDHVYPGI
jgi:hypothetical protein